MHEMDPATDLSFLIGRKVEYVCYRGRVTVALGLGDDCDLAMHGYVACQFSSSDAWVLREPYPSEINGRFATLLGAIVIDARVLTELDLAIRFDGARELRILGSDGEPTVHLDHGDKRVLDV